MIKSFKIGFLTCILGFISLHSRASETDDLKRLILKSKDDSTKVKLLNQLSQAYSDANPDTAIKISLSA